MGNVVSMMRPFAFVFSAALVALTVGSVVGCGSSGSGTNTPSSDASGASKGDALPPEFFTVCEGKDEGSACEVTMEGKTMKGKCTLPPEESGEKRRVCKPDELPQ